MRQEISCRSFESTIQDLMDQRLSIADSAMLRQHAAHCYQCSGTLAEFEALEEGLVYLCESQEFELFSMPLSQIKPVEKSLNHGRFGVMGLLASIAAVLLISLSLSNLQRAPGLVASNSGAGTTDQSFGADDHQSTEAEIPSHDVVVAQVLSTEAMQDSWEQISQRFNTLSPYYRYSAELPGVRPLQTSINLTVSFLQQTFQAQPPHASDDKPDLGMATNLRLFQA